MRSWLTATIVSTNRTISNCVRPLIETWLPCCWLLARIVQLPAGLLEAQIVYHHAETVVLLTNNPFLGQMLGSITWTNGAPPDLMRTYFAA